MQSGRDKKQKKLGKRCSQAFCGTCRVSVSSPREAESSSDSDDLQTASSIAHAMVQERLDRMIRERARNGDGSRKSRHEEMKLVVMVAMEKCSHDPREDFRHSMEEMIAVNRIEETRDLRRLLNCYVSINSQELRGIILEVFYEVCTNWFAHL